MWQCVYCDTIHDDIRLAKCNYCGAPRTTYQEYHRLLERNQVEYLSKEEEYIAYDVKAVAFDMELDKQKNYIIDFLKKKPKKWQSYSEIQKGTGLNKNRIDLCLFSLKKREMVQEKTGRKEKKYKIN